MQIETKQELFKAKIGYLLSPESRFPYISCRMMKFLSESEQSLIPTTLFAFVRLPMFHNRVYD